MDHKAFLSQDYEIVALFDVSDKKIGKEFLGKPCFSVAEMPTKLSELDIDVIMLTVPKEAAQSCVDIATSGGGIKGILNFSPSSISVPKEVIVYSVDISVELEKLLFYLKH